MKIVQYEKSGKRNKMQHEKSATQLNCNMR